MISDMSGYSGNQAVAVSMRELSHGLVRPKELLWVLAKEAKIGIINGLELRMLLGGVAYLWKGKPWLGVVVGGALAANTLVSEPLLTTMTDMCWFFFVLSFASAVLAKLGGM
ncbi:MAG: magnesium transporter [Desulforhopalus sp.]|jgi:magnesium transporter